MHLWCSVRLHGVTGKDCDDHAELKMLLDTHWPLGKWAIKIMILIMIGIDPKAF